jgi:LmbE family N-acetylglucosaminyl deacetylase
MTPVALPDTGRRALRVLCIGAHSDDIEIGCGGTLLHLQAARPRLQVDWVVLSGDADRRRETARAMASLLRPASRGELLHGDFPDASFPGSYAALKDFFVRLQRRAAPDLIFCHERQDAHQDHRVVNELTWGAFRDHVILEYEIPKWDGGLATPNAYMPLPAGLAKRKISTLMRCFGSQRSRDWFRPEIFEALMRLRGIECRSRSGFAEAFHTRKLTLSPG